MFFTVSNASKVTLVHLVRQLRAGGATLLDTQYSNPHLEQFGVVEISRDAYLEQLADALTVHPTWWPLADAEAADLNTPVDAFENAAPRDRPPAS
jgi:leucyl/phenylalanyl-tRNA--protein transferase